MNKAIESDSSYFKEDGKPVLIHKDLHDLRGNNNTLSLPKVNTTKYGLNSFRYFAAKQWNSIPNELRLRAGGLEFNKQVRNIQF